MRDGAEMPEAAARPMQLPLSMPVRAALGLADFHVSPVNAEAVAFVREPELWPSGRLALVGPKGAGKTHLVHVLIADHEEDAVALVDARFVDAAAAPALAGAAVVVVEDVDGFARLDARQARAAEDGLFHLYNFCAARGTRLLLTGREVPVRWPAATPDLASRLATLAVVRIGAPDDALLASVLLKHARDRGLDPAPLAVDWTAQRIERSFAAALRAAEAFDREAARRQRRHVSQPLAAVALRAAGLVDDEPGGPEGNDSPAADVPSEDRPPGHRPSDASIARRPPHDRRPSPEPE
ncbi:MAG: chromosomal replication initiator DnaA [Paracoccaceae bacterium]